MHLLKKDGWAGCCNMQAAPRRKSHFQAKLLAAGVLSFANYDIQSGCANGVPLEKSFSFFAHVYTINLLRSQGSILAAGLPQITLPFAVPLSIPL